MPPQTIESVWKVLQGLPGHLGLRKSTDAEDLSQESHAAQTEDMGEAAERSGGGAVNKRGREMDGQDSLSNKKARRTSEDEYRLTGKGGGKVPSDSKRITVPTNYSPPSEKTFMDQDAKARSTRSYGGKLKMGGSHRTTNTLNNAQPGKGQPSFAGTTRRATNGSKVQMNPIRVPPATKTNRQIGDGFKDENPGQKRRKAHNGGPKTKVTEVVELDGEDQTDDVESGEVLAVNKEPVNRSSDSQQSLIELGSDPPGNKRWFDPTETKHLATLTEFRRPKSRRRASSEQKTPSQSSRAAPGASSIHDGHVSINKRQPHDLEDLARPSKVPRYTDVDRAKPKPTKAERPKINLEVGFEDLEHRKLSRDVTRLNDSAPKNLWKRPTGIQGGREKLESTQPATYSEGAQSPQQQGETKLRSQFRREEKSAPPKQNTGHQRVIKRMQEKSHTGRRDSVDGSPDHLLGRTTISSRSRSTQDADQSPPPPMAERRSPSDLPPTNFVSTKRSAPSNAQPRQASESEDDTRIPLSAIYSRGCVLGVKGENKKVELVWQETDKQYIVECNEVPWKIPGKNEIMSIGQSETQSLIWSKKSLDFVLKGSFSTRTNGHLLLSFINEEARDACLNYLFEASKDEMNVAMDFDRLKKIFNHQKGLIQQDAKKKEDAAAVTAAVPSASIRGSPDDQEADSNQIEEGIIYERSEDGKSLPASMRSRMQNKPAPLAENATTSKYFDEQPRRSTRQSKPMKEPTPEVELPERWTVINQPKPWNQSVMYPPKGARRVTVDFQDLERLDEGEFLNDNVISYAMRRIEEKMAPEHRKKVHFFNSFFMEALSKKNGRPTFNYDAVKKWTKQKDLFNVPYVVVPINETLHWYVAIICNLPNLVRKPVDVGGAEFDTAVTPSQSEQESRQPSPIRDFIPDSQELDTVDKPAVERMGKLTISERHSGSDDVYSFDEDGKVTGQNSASQREEHSSRPPTAKSGKKSSKRSTPGPKKYPVDKPAVVTLDSMGNAHPNHVSILKQYVQAEAEDKRGMAVGREEIQGMKVLGIPQQPNYCDCGLFLIGYLEEFAKDPQAFANKVLSRQLDSEKDFASFDASKMRDELREDLLRLHEEQDEERLAAKKAKKSEKEKVAAGTGSAPQTSAEPTPASDAQRSPAKSQAPTAQSSKASSPAKAPSSKTPALWAPHESLEHQSASRPDQVPAGNETRPPKASQDDPHNDASDDEELESVVPRPLLQGKSEQEPRRREKTNLNQVNDSAGADPEDGDGDMLDGLADNAAELDARDESEQRTAGYHKVKSPEFDDLPQAFPRATSGPSGTTTSMPASAEQSS